MKRQTLPRNLHMGCGEELVSRVPSASEKTAQIPAARAIKPVRQKAGEGRR